MANQPNPKHSGLKITESPGSSQPGPAGHNNLHLNFNVDVIDPTKEKLDEIKNQIIQRIASSVVSESGANPAMMMVEHYDKHSSLHYSG